MELLYGAKVSDILTTTH